MNELLRHGIDHDPVKPWNWGTLVMRHDPVEIVSYPDTVNNTVFVRMMVGDPTYAKYLPLNALAAFSPDRHEWYGRPRRYYSDNPTAFVFTDTNNGE